MYIDAAPTTKRGGEHSDQRGIGLSGERPFREAVHMLAIERGLTTGMGNVNWSLLAGRLPTLHYETLRKLLSGERKLDGRGDRDRDMRHMEEIAAALESDPHVFEEYNLLEAQRAFDVNAVGHDAARQNLERWLSSGRRQRGGDRSPKSAPVFA